MRRLLALGLLCCPPVWASHGLKEIGIPVTNAEAALSSLFANPPLPMTYFQKGDYKITGMADLFLLQKPAVSLSGPSEASLDKPVLGWGGAALYDRALTEKLSFYGMFFGATLGSGRFGGRASGETRQKIATGASDRPGEIFQGGESDGSFSVGWMVGFNRRFIGRDPEGFTLSGFVGPSLYYSKGSGSSVVLSIDPGNPTANSTQCLDTDLPGGYRCIRTGYRANLWTYGILSGFQANIPAGTRFLLNPYLLLIGTNSLFSGKIQTELAFRECKGGGVCTDPSNEVELARGISSASVGLNLTYRPWGLTANLTGSVMAPLLAATAGLTQYKMLKLQASKSFGRYTR